MCKRRGVVEPGYHTGLSSRRADRRPSVSRGLAEGFFFRSLAGGGWFWAFEGWSRAYFRTYQARPVRGPLRALDSAIAGTPEGPMPVSRIRRRRRDRHRVRNLEHVIAGEPEGLTETVHGHVSRCTRPKIVGASEASIRPSVPGLPVPGWASSPSGAKRALVGGTSVGGGLWTP